MSATEVRSVLVTGASTGIGRATVRQLVTEGFRVWATVRREADAAGLVEELGAAVTPLLVDLEDHDSVRAAGHLVCAAGPLYGLVNNAGAALPGPLELIGIDVFRRQLEINLVGQLLVTQVMLPALRARAEQTGDARIVMIGSVGGRIAGPILGPYSAAKHGLVGLAGSLRAELAPSRIKVVLVEPGAVATPIWERGSEAGDLIQGSSTQSWERYRHQLESAAAMSRRGAEKGLPPEAAASVICAALTARNPQPRQSFGRDAKVIGVLVRLLPYRLIYRMVAARR